MIQQRKKDYFQRIIEEFFSKLQKLHDSKENVDIDEKKQILNDVFNFFSENFDITQSDNAEEIAAKITDCDLLEQYAKFLLAKHEIIDIKDIVQLHIALDIVKYLEKSSSTYSWDRTVLREDLLRLLDN